MIFLGKKIPKKARKGIVKIALLIVGICAVISMPLIASLGWFSSNPATRTTGMQVVVTTETYELLIDRPLSEVYDKDLVDSEGFPVYPNIEDLKTQMTADGYDFTETSTSDAPLLAFELTNEYMDSEGSYSLIPGSYGTLTFYLRPRAGADGSTVRLSLIIGGYKNGYDEEDNPIVSPVDDATALNMLKGHLLFFTSRTGARHADYQYSGLIEDESFAYDMSAHSKCEEVGKTDCYKITLYWEWPMTYEEIYYNTSTVSPAVTKKYPAALTDYVSDHPDYLFANGADPDSDTLEKMVDGYNDGDQAIGDNVHLVVVGIR